VGRVLVIRWQATAPAWPRRSLEDRPRQEPGPHAAPGRPRPAPPPPRPRAPTRSVRKAREKALAEGRPDPADRDRRAQCQGGRGRRPAARRGSQGPKRRAPLRAAPARSSPPRHHVVQPGDNLWTIATRLGTTVEELQGINRMSKRQARALQVGQTLANRRLTEGRPTPEDSLG